MFVHIGVSRLRIATLSDSVVVFLVPIPLMFANSLVGRTDIWPWFYYASGYLVIALGSWHWQVRMASAEKELASFRRLASPLGTSLVLYAGIPFYAVAGWVDRQGLLSPFAELLVASSPIPAALILAQLFFRDWHRAIAEAQTGGREIPAVAAAKV